MGTLYSQLIVGLINGCFYALLSLGLAVIFGMLNIVNFAHGALFMTGAFLAWIGLTQVGPWLGYDNFQISYWWALLLVPLIVGALGVVIERTMLKHLYRVDPLYGMLLTFALAWILEGLFRHWYGATGRPYEIPDELYGVVDLGFLLLPLYRVWVVAAAIVACLGTWLLIERTKLGAYLRAATENPKLVEAFGINVPVLVTLTYGFGVALAAFAGVLAAPIMQVSPKMGADLIIIVFAVVVVGGMGSIMGSIVTGLFLGVIEGLTKVFYPEASAIVIFLIMSIVLMIRPAGLFGR
ncbi:branched-chain amino acid ABC transporter permease [Pseudorhodoplanes sp.]|uniref:branched-chain amino acid ABC transporter permease n=1 Tax=Pseudorhodoplanes sp. TaxID=1934341 RepID=UPI003D0C513A